jgi:hypothetical protein
MPRIPSGSAELAVDAGGGFVGVGCRGGWLGGGRSEAVDVTTGVGVRVSSTGAAFGHATQHMASKTDAWARGAAIHGGA